MDNCLGIASVPTGSVAVYPDRLVAQSPIECVGLPVFESGDFLMTSTPQKDSVFPWATDHTAITAFETSNKLYKEVQLLRNVKQDAQVSVLVNTPVDSVPITVTVGTKTQADENTGGIFDF